MSIDPLVLLAVAGGGGLGGMARLAVGNLVARYLGAHLPWGTLVVNLGGALLMGLAGLGVFFWAMRSGQFEDLDGAANRILIDEEDVAE